MTLEWMLFILAGLLFVSILASKISDRVGIPALLLFLVVGMLAGADGPGGIYFDDARLSQNISVIALAVILFAGGLETDWKAIRPVLGPGLALALVGVLLTSAVMGLAAWQWWGFSLYEGLLLGAIVSSTDAAAVFSVLRSRGLRLKGSLAPLLELESGSNDPMAIFLTVSLIALMTQPELTLPELLPRFVAQMGIGALLGLGLGQAALWLVNRIRLGFDGLYPVLLLALVLAVYSLTALLGGSGFLAVYLAGLRLGNAEFIHRRSMLRFFDGLAWLMQIGMFLTLGLLVFPSQLPGVALNGLLAAATLMLVARPLGVLVSLLPFRLGWREIAFVAWVGLRGATPIVLATFPLLAGIGRANDIFNLVFFIVLASVLLQGPSLAWVARRLGVDAPPPLRRPFPIEANSAGGSVNQLKELKIGPATVFVGRAIFELSLPQEFLVILIEREGEFIIPSGATQLQADDTLLVISDPAAFTLVRERAKASRDGMAG